MPTIVCSSMLQTSALMPSLEFVMTPPKSCRASQKCLLTGRRLSRNRSLDRATISAVSLGQVRVCDLFKWSTSLTLSAKEKCPKAGKVGQCPRAEMREIIPAARPKRKPDSRYQIKHNSGRDRSQHTSHQ